MLPLLLGAHLAYVGRTFASVRMPTPPLQGAQIAFFATESRHGLRGHAGRSPTVSMSEAGSEFGIDATVSLVEEATSGARSRLATPSTDLLRSKRPLGYKQLSRGGRAWLAREMKWMAQHFI